MNPPPFRVRSAVRGEVWPGLPAAHGAQLAALLFQFEQSERLAPDTLLQRQFSQLARLVEHAVATVPYYQSRRAAYPAPGACLDPVTWAHLPILSRRDIQTAGDELRSQAIPRALGEIFRAETSGSTGEPVRVYRSSLDHLLWEALTLREHYWHGRDFGAKLASIRVFDGGAGIGAAPAGTLRPRWDGPASALHETGPMALLALDTDLEIQRDWLARQDPDHLLTYPTNLAGLLDIAATDGWKPPRLRVVRTVGETVDADLRARCRAQWGLEIVDLYSSRELGYLALQCPLSGHYHVTAETVLVEILDERGHAVAPGGIGRVVVTPLHAFPMPLLRYDLGDHAEVAPPCPCGRGLPTLRRILGRTRNMVVLPDGSRHWPLVGFARFREVAPVSQYQLVQTSLTRVTVRLVVERPLETGEEAALATIIRDALGHPFTLDFEYVADRLAPGPGGKFEEFVSALA